MTLDGVLVTMFGALVCFAAGVVVAEHYHYKQERRDGHWAQVIEQQQAQIEAMQDYIRERSDDDAELRSMFGDGK